MVAIQKIVRVVDFQSLHYSDAEKNKSDSSFFLVAIIKTVKVAAVRFLLHSIKKGKWSVLVFCCNTEKSESPCISCSLQGA